MLRVDNHRLDTVEPHGAPCSTSSLSPYFFERSFPAIHFRASMRTCEWRPIFIVSANSILTGSTVFFTAFKNSEFSPFYGYGKLACEPRARARIARTEDGDGASRNSWTGCSGNKPAKYRIPPLPEVGCIVKSGSHGRLRLIRRLRTICRKVLREGISVDWECPDCAPGASDAHRNKSHDADPILVTARIQPNPNPQNDSNARIPGRLHRAVVLASTSPKLVGNTIEEYSDSRCQNSL